MELLGGIWTVHWVFSFNVIKNTWFMIILERLESLVEHMDYSLDFHLVKNASLMMLECLAMLEVHWVCWLDFLSVLTVQIWSIVYERYDIG